MKKNILLSALAVAGTGIVAYLLTRDYKNKKKSDPHLAHPRSHHRVEVFAKAKQKAVGHDE